MGLDYQNHNGEKEFYFKVDENNEGRYPSGRTGYE
jgi:hypothetical protein